MDNVSRSSHFNRFCFSFFLLFVLVACGQDSDELRSKNDQAASSEKSVLNESKSKAKTKLSGSKTSQEPNTIRDWKTISESGVIRALKLKWEEEDSLPRSGSTSLFHIELFNHFAKKHQLKIEWIKVDDLEQMFDYLKQYKADVIPRHLTITENRRERMNFTHPLMLDVEVLVAKKGTATPSAKDQITVNVPQGTSFVEGVKRSFPNWKVEYTDGALNSEAIADLLSANKILYSILDGQSANTLMAYDENINILTKLPDTRQLSWATDKKNHTLLDKLNEFIAVHHIANTSRLTRISDLDTIKQDKLSLRVITRNSPETYFLWRGELMGFEYELMREFAKRQGLRLEIIVADNFQQMKDLLELGKGDVIAAGLSRTKERSSQLRFSSRYNRVSELLVANKDSLPIKKLSDLKNRTISIRQSSAFWQTAQLLANSHGAKVIAASENLPTELLIAQVANKKIDLTIADSNIVSIEKRFRENIETPLTLKEGVPYAYAVRKNNSKLLTALNAFIKKEYRGTFYNVVKAKYFANQKRLSSYRSDRITSDSMLSPYDQLVKENARNFQFDWRLITSQMFQESRFNPQAKSSAGAQGLMQVLPRTAKELGFVDLTNPEQSVAAGVQYLDWTRARFSKKIPLEERLFFALAAYNAGFGHVRDAQRLAKSMNLRQDKWFNHVEKAMLLLQQPEYYKKTRFGYCRGSEPVNYVREIQQRYLSYVDITY